jgi:hypothetical protein
LATKLAISEDETLKGKGVLGGVEALQGMDEESRRLFLGESQELNVAYQTLTANLPEVRQRIAEINAELETMRAGGKSVVQKQFEEFFDPSSERGQRRLALEQQRQAEIAREIANEQQLSLQGMQTQATRDRVLAEMKTQREATFGQFAVEQVSQGAELLGGAGGGDRTTEAATEVARRYFGGTESNLEFLARNIQDAILPLGILKRMVFDDKPTKVVDDATDEQSKKDAEQLRAMQEVAQHTKAMAEGLPVVRVAGAF